MTPMSGYDDGRVACLDNEILIRQYSMLRRPKHVSYSSIREARVVPLGMLGKLRIHGSGDLVHWFSYDPARPGKDRAIVLHAGGRIRPVITPDDPDQVAGELRAHGVNVTEGRESGLR
jgi:hypothetical protein